MKVYKILITALGLSLFLNIHAIRVIYYNEAIKELDADTGACKGIYNLCMDLPKEGR